MYRMAEFNKLEQMLIDDGIEYDKETKVTVYLNYSFNQLRSKDTIGDKWVWDVVCHEGTYGYCDGLLEMWGKDMDEPIGWLTAEQCLEKIKEIIKR